jgi:NAD(P)-dependent dehydrogenase (short-subunit alcohol dehydrogenase family)
MAGSAMIMTTFAERLFDGKTALVTGAAGGIGAGIARCFSSLGATVLLQDKEREGLAQMAAELAGARGGVATLDGDLSVPGVADSVFDGALDAGGRVDFLVNNAGRSSAATTLEIAEPATQSLIELNL